MNDSIVLIFIASYLCSLVAFRNVLALFAGVGSVISLIQITFEK